MSTTVKIAVSSSRVERLLNFSWNAGICEKRDTVIAEPTRFHKERTMQMRITTKAFAALAASSVLFAGCGTAVSSSSSTPSQPSEPQVSLEVPASSSAPQVPQVTMAKVAEANTGKAFLEAYGRVSKNVTEYNWYDHDTYTAMFYIEGDENEQSTAYEDSNGYVEITTGGKGFVYNPGTERSSVRCYFGEEYQDTLEQSVELFVFQEMDYEKIVSAELNKAGDTLELVTEYDVADDLEYYQETYGIEDGIIRNVYQLDPETLRIRELKVSLADGGASSPICDIVVNTETSYTVPEKLTAIMRPEKTRTVSFVMDPGTASEQTIEEKIAFDAALSFMVPDGYKVYADKECTQLYIANGKSGDETVYLKKAA